MKIIVAGREAAMWFLGNIRKIQFRYQGFLMVQPIVLLVVLFVGGIFTAEVMAQQAGHQSAYTLGPGDKILIRVFGEDDLSMEVRLGGAGLLNYPYLGSLQVSGLGVAELEQRITDGLKGQYLVDPDVTVSILEYRPFYLNGEVSDPGGFPYQPGLTLARAIALGGGFTPRASKNKVTVVRADDPSLEARPIELNDPVKPGDVIVVPERFF
jgi:protein involved in polysaccharide export with SLBB domain